MKKIQCLLSISVMAIALIGCNKIDDLGTINSGKIEVQITGGINHTPSRATAEGFIGGDAVGIYVVNYNGETPGELLDNGNQADCIKYTFDESKNKWVPMGKVYYKDELTPVNLYGYYPYSKPSTVLDYSFELKQDQSKPSESGSLSGYEASDFLWGKTDKELPSKSAVRISYNHLMSCALVVLKEGEGFKTGEFDNIDRSVIMTGITRQSTINLSKGIVTAKGEIEVDGTIMNSSVDGFRAITIPQGINAMTPLFTITLDGVVYNFKKNEAFEFPAGKMSKFTIVVNKKEITGAYELVLNNVSIDPWVEDSETHAGMARQYYVVDVQTPGTLGETLKSLNKDGAKIINLKITGSIDQRDFVYMRDTMAVLRTLNLKEVHIKAHVEGSYNYGDNEIPYEALKGKEALYFIVFPDDITKIGDYAFEDTSLTGSLVVPDGVTEIGNSAFSGCSNLVGLTLPSALIKIGDYAFSHCSSIRGNLSLPQGLEYIGGDAFYNCNFTGTLDLPVSLSYIGNRAFWWCSGFTGSLKIPEKVTMLYDATFYGCSGMRGQLILHDNLKFEKLSSPWGVFSRCSFTGELVLPKDLVFIPGSTFAGCLFSSIAGFPETLTEIGGDAFSGCWRLSGVLEFPKNITVIGSGAFSGCSTLEGVVFPEKLATIKSSAFKDCFYINSIVSKSLVPPMVDSGAFDGVPKDNFTVEVPEKSVGRYQSANLWSSFKRISAYRDFSINRRFTRWLNSEGSKKLYLKALEGAEWSVESKPDWITITPESGRGKAEVTVTAQSLAKGSQMRTGEVVFKLSGTDYLQKTTVEQYDYQYGDGDVVPLKSATKGKGVNIVVMGDCYDAKDISDGIYLKDITEAYNHIFSVEPYKSYADYFNVYGVVGLSEDTGIGTINNEKNALFGSQYFIEHGVSIDDRTCFEYACKAPIDNKISETVVVIIPNTTTYAGITYMWGDGSAIALCPKSEDAYPYDFRGIVQHEAGGHAFGKFGDEYIYTHYWVDKNCVCLNPHADELRQGKAMGWYRNLSLTSDTKSVDWSHLIYHPSYSNIVDVFEGGWFHTKNVWRSEPNSCMNNNIPYYSAISRQDIVERIMKQAGEKFDINDFYAKDVLGQSPQSRSSLQQHIPPLYKNNQQHAPKYMGEKPDFKPSKK